MVEGFEGVTPDGLCFRLTPEQAATAALWAAGLALAEIAERLCVCKGTVRYRLGRCCDLTGAANTRELIAVVIRAGLPVGAAQAAEPVRCPACDGRGAQVRAPGAPSWGGRIETTAIGRGGRCELCAGTGEVDAARAEAWRRQAPVGIERRG